MIDANSSLADVCFAVAGALEANGMSGVLTGGSAASLYAPQAYTSRDADFVLDADDSLERVAKAVLPLGYVRNGRSRIFTHRVSEFTLDFPKGPLAIGGEYVTETDVVEDQGRRLRILRRTDCIRDRLAHFYFWSDYEALNAAVAVAATSPDGVDIDNIRAWTRRESTGLLEKFGEFERRLRAYRGP